MLLKLQQLINHLDRMISKQLIEIIHHPKMQALEASWRSLYDLVTAVKQGKNILIKVLTISREELQKDLLAVIEFDQSQLFHKIYSQEIGLPGGLPYNVVITDFYFSNQHNDVEVLHALAQIGAAAFAPIITAAAPSLFGINEFSTLTNLSDFSRIFQQQEYQAWERLRQEEDSKFLGLTLPKRLVRLPYTFPYDKAMPFVFTDAESERGYLWGNASYAFAKVLVRSYQVNGWLADIRGFHGDQSPDGHILPMVEAYYSTDKPGLFVKPQTECMITDNQERQLKQLGMMSFSQVHHDAAAVFYHTASLQKAKNYSKHNANINAQTAIYLQYLLCACRFGHYLKILGRDKIGSGVSALECENWLSQWLLKYIAANGGLSALQRSQYPLQDAKVKVSDMPGKPGYYRCVIHLKPHFQLEQLQSSVVLVTEIQQ